ncbi:hypothetical protein M430DRAFT_61666 [Amorphotheca resinae ATCC 22711]|uniref:Uncharacterized protein n=1 Tax=Amorphotheca resinae ATCC 22711 TaxID=857342 RepID=A0A2T3AQC9_AMORE|nr:hypothetical protein M430DRAFT_61666 [Amorphotheca resinae ATCC 22711]PSS08467.1 hypothetical protein M430DRAFT_61666 [Amorphotheca resinae ATCC 22711]
MTNMTNMGYFRGSRGSATKSESNALYSETETEPVRRWRKRAKTAHVLQPEWGQPARKPYHEYVHQLLGAGWANLQDLDEYMSDRPAPTEPFVVSVLDILDDFKLKQWPDLNNEHDLSSFTKDQSREGVNVRLYMAEYSSRPSAGMIEAFGSSFGLDPRFFNWAIDSKNHVFTPAQRHRAPYIRIGFGVLDRMTHSKTDTERFKVLVYIQPDEQGTGWTGIIFFSSHTKIALSPRIVTDPPAFQSALPSPRILEPKSFRELYLESFEFVNLEKAASSPFYTIANLLYLNCFCWSEVITTIREEDQRINGISDTSVEHTEEIKKSLAMVQRGGSLGWRGQDEAHTADIRQRLEEDFKHLVNQTDLLWSARHKMAAISQHKSESRWTSLTNAFTYLFAPITIMSGVYGMNVSEISGSDSNPNIWQFFVAVVAMNVVVLLSLAISNWVHTMRKHGRKAGVREILGFAVGRISTK